MKRWTASKCRAMLLEKEYARRTQAADAGAQGAKPAFGVVDFSLFFAAEVVRAAGQHAFVGQPKIAARGMAAVVRW